MTLADTPSEQAGLDRLRATRRRIEAAVLPLATSIDGRGFAFQASLHGLDVRPGGYVVLTPAGGAPAVLGQVLDLRLATQDAAEIGVADGDDPNALRARLSIRHAVGEGTLLEPGATFHDATMRPATADEVGAWVRRGRARLEVGELALVPGVPCRIDARGFDRHTFLCGQSGSGKTYSLGVLLERLLTETSLRIVILDPNSDFVRLAAVRGGTEAALVDRYRAATAGVEVFGARASGARRLRLRLGELEPAAQAALLHLDPIRDREEYAEFVQLLGRGVPPSAGALDDVDRPDARRLALRVRNLGAEEYGIWAREDPGSLLDAVADPDRRCVVVDLGSLPTRDEQALTGAAVLGELWRRREERRPVLIVIDEAHNVCPAEPADPLTALATEHAVRIAAEGRKFGLYLLVSTQRPQKVPENVVSQCDNLVLMRLNSRADAAFAEEVFSFVPAGLIAQAPAFGLGGALVAGKVSPAPALVRFGARVSEEGGSDVPSSWAAAGPVA
jgi:hypothetical protein